MTPETPVERRLREMARTLGREHDDDLDCARDAIALLREHSAIATNATWARKRRQLLARCGQEGT